MAIFGDSVLLLTLNFHSQVCGTRQLMTIRGLHAGLPFQSLPRTVEMWV